MWPPESRDTPESLTEADGYFVILFGTVWDQSLLSYSTVATDVTPITIFTSICLPNISSDFLKFLAKSYI